MTVSIPLTHKSDLELIQTITDALENTNDEYSSLRAQYLEAAEKLKEAGNEEVIDTLIAACNQQIASDIRFAAAKGFQANLAFFRHPVGNNFLQESAEIYLQENVMKALPARVHAQQTIDSVLRNFSEAMAKYYDHVQEYFSYLETVCPKLAHYCGFVAADTLLYYIEPGYVSAPAVTLCYKLGLQRYLGIQIDVKVIP